MSPSCSEGCAAEPENDDSDPSSSHSNPKLSSYACDSFGPDESQEQAHYPDEEGNTVTAVPKMTESHFLSVPARTKMTDNHFFNFPAGPKMTDSHFLNVPAVPKMTDSHFLNVPAGPKMTDSQFLNVPAVPKMTEGSPGAPHT